MGGIGTGLDIGNQFSVSQQAKTNAQLDLMENAVDIKVRFSQLKPIKPYV